MILSTRWIKVFRDLWGHKPRTLLVILSIAVGIFAVGMTISASRIIERDLNTQYAATNPASTTLYMAPFGDDLARAVEDMREVDQAEARRVETAQARTAAGDWVDFELDAAGDFGHVRVNHFGVDAGQGIPGLREILVERQTAEWLSLSLGDTLTIRRADDGRVYDLAVAGIVHDMSKPLPMFFEQGAGYVSLDTLDWMGLGRSYNALHIAVADRPADRAHILRVAGLARDRVIEPAGGAVHSVRPFETDPGTHWASPMVTGVLIVLTLIGGMCLLIGAGLVINTVSAQIAREVRQIGVMRTLGGVPRQVAAMYLGSVLIVSLCALGIAIPLGKLGAEGLAGWVGSMLNFDVTETGLSPSVLGIQIGLGLLVPLAAALVPILAAARMTAYQAIYQSGSIGAGSTGGLEEALKRFRGLSGPAILAVRNTFRRRTRLAFTLATLTLAGATFMAAFSTQRTLSQQIAGMGRYYLLDVSMDVPGGANVHTVEREARRAGGVQIAEGWYQASAVVVASDAGESEAVEVAAVPFDAATLDPLLVAGRWLRPGDTNALVINEDVLDKVPGLRVGDAISLRVGSSDPGGDRPYEIVGIASRHLDGPRLYAPYDFFTRAHGVGDQATVVRVAVVAGTSQSREAQEALAGRLTRHFEDAQLPAGETVTQYQAVASNTGNFDVLLTVLLLMSGLLALAGGLGLAGTMSLNVLERSREIGVMRAIGATNGLVRRVVLFEGVTVALIGWGLSAALSLPLGYGLASAVSAAVLAMQARYVVSGTGIGLWLGLVLGIGVLAALLPALRASRLPVREVLAYE